MRSFEIAMPELKRLVSARPFRLAVAVVCLVPLLYGALYLWAFWNPYQRLDQLPVALIMSDKPVRSAGHTLHVGADLERQLRKSHSFAWHVVSAADAAEGLQNGRYYMTLTVPANFSSRLAHANDDHPLTAELVVQTNESTNLLASQIGGRVFTEVRASLAEATSRRYLDQIFFGLTNLRDGMVHASSGTGRLASALGKASTGSRQLSGGLSSASSGARSLRGGLSKLSSGASNLHAGVAKAATGAGRLAAGVRTAGAGARSVASGSRTVAVGTQSLSASLIKLNNLCGTLKSASSRLVGGASQVADGTSSAAARGADAAHASSSLSTGAGQLQTTLAAYSQAHPDAADDATFRSALAAASEVSTGLAQLSADLNAAEPGLKTLAIGAASVGTGAQQLAAGMSGYSAAIGRAARGASQLSGGAERLSSGAVKLADGVAATRGATRQLAAGTGSLATGSAQLAAAAAQANNGSASLAAGVQKLAAGGATLRLGLGRAAAGGATLASQLKRGVAGIPVLTPVARRARAAMMSAPVSMSTTRVHQVPNYGTGFAPYFIPLALWVGALMAFFLVRPLGGRALASTVSDRSVVLAGLWPGVVITCLQTVVMLAVLEIGLGLRPVQPLALYAFALVAALAFTSILQLLSAALGTAGKFVAVVLLMLQLTSSAGTFPIETAPRFFRVINPLLPMTYVVSGLRQAISGGSIAAVATNAGILLVYAAGAVLLTMLAAHRQRTWTMDRLKPVVTL
jgi:putative membrane protein